MRGDASLRTVEPLAAVRVHPVAATVGGLVSAIVLGGFAAAAGGAMAGLVMAVVGVIVGAPGGSHIAEAAAQSNRPV